MGRASVFENRKWVPLFAGSAALSWACAFPLIKLGLADFGIAGTDTGGKALRPVLQVEIHGESLA